MNGFAPWGKVIPPTLAAFGVAGVLDWLLVSLRNLTSTSMLRWHRAARRLALSGLCNSKPRATQPLVHVSI